MKTKRVEPLNYAFAIAKIRCRERFLIRQEVFSEAIESDLEGALGLFAETGLYPEGLLHITDSRQLEVVLRQELLALRKLMTELILDKVLLGLLGSNTVQHAKEVWQGYPSIFLEDYLRHLVDMHNIKSFLRLYILREPLETLKAALTCEGFIKKGDFLRLYTQDLAVFLHRLEYVSKRGQPVDYACFLREPLQRLERERSFLYIEKAMHDFLMQALRPAKYISFGPEPLVAYYLAKVNEMDLMRMVILAKLNAVSPEVVKERLSLAYV